MNQPSASMLVSGTGAASQPFSWRHLITLIMLSHRLCGCLQNMIFAYCDIPNNVAGIQRHTGRSALVIRFDDACTARVVDVRLDITRVQAHAWMMFVVWGVLVPFAIMWARYSRVGADCNIQRALSAFGIRVSYSLGLLCMIHHIICWHVQACAGRNCCIPSRGVCTLRTNHCM